jgi:hypothetical protein
LRNLIKRSQGRKRGEICQEVIAEAITEKERFSFLLKPLIQSPEDSLYFEKLNLIFLLRLILLPN